MPPSATRKLKITADDLAKVNPNLIYAQVRGYAHGPQEDDLATNPVAEAATGVMFDHVIDGRPSRSSVRATISLAAIMKSSMSSVARFFCWRTMSTTSPCSRTGCVSTVSMFSAPWRWRAS